MTYTVSIYDCIVRRRTRSSKVEAHHSDSHHATYGYGIRGITVRVFRGFPTVPCTVYAYLYGSNANSTIADAAALHVIRLQIQYVASCKTHMCTCAYRIVLALACCKAHTCRCRHAMSSCVVGPRTHPVFAVRGIHSNVFPISRTVLAPSRPDSASAFALALQCPCKPTTSPPSRARRLFPVALCWAFMPSAHRAPTPRPRCARCSCGRPTTFRLR